MNLIIMAAGMGSRFGGLKQIEPIDNNGNFIIDYSIFDAIRCGFDKVIFIIKQENYEIFKTTIGERIEKFVKVEYVFQNNSNIPSTYNFEERTKPFGTGHAVLCAKNNVDCEFAVINADDFYGYDAFKVLAEFLKNKCSKTNYAIVGYHVKNTMGSGSSVKRGICQHQNGKLQSITESNIEILSDGLLHAKAIDGSSNEEKIIEPDTIVSMNMFGFHPSFMEHLENGFLEFLKKNKNDLGSVEYFLPTVASNAVISKTATIEVLDTTATWLGITYKQDKDEVSKALAGLVDQGVYPKNLWNE